MRSSFSVIKSNRVVSEGASAIETKYSSNFTRESIYVDDRINTNEISKEINSGDSTIESNEKIAASFIEKAKQEAENIKSIATKEAELIRNSAYEDAFAKGQEQGFNNGHKEGLLKAAEIEEEIMINANNVLFQANKIYKNYFIEKESEIKNLILEICSKVLEKEVSEDNSLNNMIFNAISNIKNAKVVIVKTNSHYSDSIKNEISNWKSHLAFNGDIFCIEDNSIENGKAIIEKDNGKIIIDIEYALEKIKESFMEE